MNLKRLTVKGIGWVITSQVFRLVITFAVTTILARLLNPDDFGLLAMVVVFINFASILNDIGLPAALVQRRSLTEEQKSSCFWINMIEGMLITLILIAVSPLIASFYSKSQLKPITMVLSFNFVISSLGMIQAGLLAKDMAFGKIAFIEIISAVFAGIAAVVMAYAGFGVWSLVFQSLIASLIMAVMFFFSCYWKPRFICKWKPVKELFWFGINLTGFNLVNYLSRNIDNLLIGKFLGSLSLGFYSLAYRLFLLPLQTISGVVGRVMFPALSLIQDEEETVRNVYIKATRLLASVTFPLCTGLFIIAPQFIRVAFGDKWSRTIFLTQVLALVGITQSITTTVGWIYQSRGRTDIMFKWSLFATTISILSFIIGLYWDIEGVAIAYACANFLLIYPCFYFSFRLIKLNVFDFIKRLTGIASATATMGLVTYIVRFLLEKIIGLNDLIILITTATISILMYIIAILIFDRFILLDILSALSVLREKGHKD